MSHLHIPDGVMPALWWIAGYIVVVIIMYLLLSHLNRDEVRAKIPRAALAAAFMLVAMSVPLGVIPLHLSMAVLAGILVGPGLGFLSVFVVNVVLALMGHGGITIVGLNTIVIGLEALIGAKIFQYLVSKLAVGKAAFLSVVPALLVSMILMFTLVGGTVSWGEALPHHHPEHDEHEHHGNEHKAVHEDHQDDYHDDPQEDHHEDHSDDYHDDYAHDHERGETFTDALADFHVFTITGGAALLLIVLIGITFEGLLTAVIISYIAKVNRGLIFNLEEIE